MFIVLCLDFSVLTLSFLFWIPLQPLPLFDYLETNKWNIYVYVPLFFFSKFFAKSASQIHQISSKRFPFWNPLSCCFNLDQCFPRYTLYLLSWGIHSSSWRNALRFYFFVFLCVCVCLFVFGPICWIPNATLCWFT